MNRLVRWLQPLLIVCAVALFPTAVSAAPVLFQATITIAEQVIPSQTPACLLTGFIQGTGTTSKIGPVTLTSTDCINPLPPTFTSFGFASHNVVLTAANGDQLFATYAGILSAEGRINGSYVIFGGTGRFAHAVGTGVLSGFESIDQTTGAGAGQIRLRGVLAY